MSKNNIAESTITYLLFKFFSDVSDGNINEGPSEARFYQFAIEGVAQSIVGLLGLLGKV